MAAQAGDRDAFATLIDAEAQGAFRVAQVVVRDRLLAQDAVQEACIRAWRDLPTLRDAERWPQWFRRIAVRAAIDQARREGRQRRVTGVEPTSFTADGTEAVSRRDALERVLRHLSADERALLALRFATDLELPDVATALGIPLGTAKSRLHRALTKLRARLEADP